MTIAQSSPPGLARCIHCGQGNTAGAAFCHSCGKALPLYTTPRIIEDGSFAESSVGQSMQLELLAKQASTAWKALLAVAIIQTLGAIAFTALLMKELGPIVPVITFGIALTFWALCIWARRNPLPASVCGMIVFVTLIALDAIADPTQLVRGWLLKIIVISVLAKAISAGIKHRELRGRMSDGLEH